MKLFTCSGCGQLVYFENVACTRCGATLGFVAEETTMDAFTAGEGGVVLTDDEDMASRARLIHNIGRVLGKPGYVHYLLSSNYRMSEFQAALIMEALKFYPKDSDLPDTSAFFGRLSNQRFKEHPEAFLKTKLLELHRRLSGLSVAAARREPTEARKKRKWWRV